MVGLQPTIPVKVNGVDLKMLTDSGSFFSLLTPQTAAKLKLKLRPPPDGPASIIGVGGSERIGIATADDFTIVGFTFHHADFMVAGLPNAQIDGIIGDNILSFADVEFDLSNGAIRLFKPVGCGDQVVLAYWTQPGQASSIPIAPAVAPHFQILGHVRVNGHDMRAIFDTGSSRSFITRTAARAAGVSTDDAGVKPTGLGGGVGGHQIETWTAPFKSFRIGQEEVKGTTLRVGDTDLENADMLIGADFFLSHRVYVANSQRKLYFTYNGGPVFNLEGGAPPGSQSVTQSEPTIPGAPSDKPTDADGYSRRGAAFLARRDYADAIADFTAAAKLDPTNAGHLYDRGMAHWRNKEPALAVLDFSEALKLKPNDVDTMMARAELRLQQKDDAGAASDFSAAEALAPDKRLTVGSIYVGARQFEHGIGEYDHWIADHGNNPKIGSALISRCRARALWDQQLDQALSDCNLAIRGHADNAEVFDSRGLVYLRLGQYEKAIADYSAALRIQPKLPWSLYGRGLARLHLGQRAEGGADLAAATALVPDVAEVAKSYGFAP